MKSHTTSEGYLLIMQKGEQLVDTLQTFCQENDITGGFVTGLGGVTAAEIGFYDLAKQQYHWQQYHQGLELASLSGTIAMVDGQPVTHIHVVLADSQFRSYGGHLKEATVGGTCEIYLETIDVQLERKPDDETGLKLIQ